MPVAGEWTQRYLLRSVDGSRYAVHRRVVFVAGYENLGENHPGRGQRGRGCLISADKNVKRTGADLSLAIARWTRWAKAGGLAVSDQGLISGTNFVMNIVLARYLG